MRVITGSAKGTRLKTPNGLETRPTADRVKEGIFSIVQFEVPGSSVLDLFAGTGQLGIEALSRGARQAVFIDSSREAIHLIQENVKKAKVQDSSKIVQTDYLAFLTQNTQKFHMIFLDPPYAENFLETALQKISEIDILTDSGIIICESPVEKQLFVELSGFSRKDYRYGKTKITVFRKSTV